MRYLGVILIILAALFWGVSGGIANLLMNHGWSPLVIAFYRGFIGLICFFIWSLFYFGKTKVPTLKNIFWSSLAGLGVVGNFTLYFLSIQASSISVAVTLMYTAPIFVLATALIIGIERSTWIKWWIVLIVVFGVVLLTQSYTLDEDMINAVGIVTGIASGLAYTLFLFAFKKASSIGDVSVTLTLAFFVFSFVLFLLIDLKEAIEVVSSKDLGWFALLGFLGGGISFFVYVIGLRRTRPSTASVVAMIEPTIAVIIGVLFLDNHLSLIQGVGIGFILLSIVILARTKRYNNDNKHFSKF